MSEKRIFISGDYLLIKKPQELTRGRDKRKSFSISQKVGTSFKTLKVEELVTINGNYLGGVITAEQAFSKVKELVKTLYLERDKSKPQIVHMAANYAVLNKYWKDKYSDRDLIDSESMKNDIRRAIAAVGKYSLISASKDQLQKNVNLYFKEKPNLQRRAVTRLNQLLIFLGRGFTLNKVRERMNDVSHLSLREWRKVSKYIDEDSFHILCWVAFTTGLRLGEIFAITDSNIHWTRKYIKVTRQVDSNFIKRETKTRRDRRAFFINEGAIWLEKWVDLPKKEKDRIRNLNHARKLQKACMAVYTEQDKIIKFHDLRHSYAVHLLSNEVPLAFVAQSLGNSHKVCEKYYLGFVLADESINTISRIMANA